MTQQQTKPTLNIEIRRKESRERPAGTSLLLHRCVSVQRRGRGKGTLCCLHLQCSQHNLCKLSSISGPLSRLISTGTHCSSPLQGPAKLAQTSAEKSPCPASPFCKQWDTHIPTLSSSIISYRGIQLFHLHIQDLNFPSRQQRGSHGLQLTTYLPWAVMNQAHHKYLAPHTTPGPLFSKTTTAMVFNTLQTLLGP